MKNFIQKNAVLVMALVSALTLVLQQAMMNHSTDWKAIGFACFIGVLSVFSNQWQGKGVTVLGIIATLAGTFTTIWKTGTFTWNEFILSAIVALLTAVAGTLQPKTST